jgi:NAD(P)-dependent dehydrogenase (short-subunit alcohol dehydrogenase family)
MPGLVTRNLLIGGGRKVTGADYPLRRLMKAIDINFASAFVLIQASLPLLRRPAQEHPERGTKVIALSSITGAYAEPGSPPMEPPRQQSSPWWSPSTPRSPATA